MNSFVQNLVKYVGNTYAHVVINALFLLCLCWTVDLWKRAFSYQNLKATSVLLGISFIPLLVWTVIYFILFRQKTRFYYSYNSRSKLITWVGIVMLIITFFSIVRDIYSVLFERQSFIPAGIIGQYFNFILPPENWSWQDLSFWLVLRYLLIILFFYSYVLSFRKIIHFKPSSFLGEKSLETTPKKQQTPKKKPPAKKRRKHRKKLNFIE